MSKVRKQTEIPKGLNLELFERTPSLEQVGLRDGSGIQLQCFSEKQSDNKGNWADREVYFSLQSQPAMLEKSRQKLPTAGHTTSMARIRGWGMHACPLACAQLNFSILIQVWNSFIGNGATRTDLNMPIGQLNVGNPLSGLSSQVVASCRWKLNITYRSKAWVFGLVLYVWRW